MSLDDLVVKADNNSGCATRCQSKAVGMKLPIGVFLFTLVAQVLAMDPPGFIWEKYSDPGAFYHVEVLQDGTLAVAGYRIAGQDTLMGVLKCDLNGQELWTWDAGDQTLTTVRAVEQIESTDLAVVGGMSPMHGLPIQQMLAVISNEGDEIMRCLYSFDESATAYCVAQMSDGGFCIGGTMTLYKGGMPTIIRTGSNGQLLWWTQFPGASGVVRSVHIKEDGGIVAFVDQVYDPPVIGELDASGALVWSYDYSGSLPSGDGDMLAWDEGYALVSGNRLAGVGFTGDPEWLVYPPGSHSRSLYSVSQTMDNGLILSGAVDMYWDSMWNYHPYDGWLVRTDDTGDCEWWLKRTLGSDTYFYCARQLSQGGYGVCGRYGGFAYLAVLEPETGSPDQLQLADGPHSYPNPFVSQLSIDFSLLEPSQVSMEVFDLSGHLVHITEPLSLDAGTHSIDWSPGSDLVPGIYIVRVNYGSEEEILRCTHL